MLLGFKDYTLKKLICILYAKIIVPIVDWKLRDDNIKIQKSRFDYLKIL